LKKLTFVFAVVVLAFVAVFPANAQEASLTSKFRSAYLGTTGGMFYDDNVQQTYLDLNWRNGLWAEVWTSTAFDLRDNFGKEIDLGFGKTGKAGQFTYAADFYYYFIQGKDVLNVNGEIGLPLAEGLFSPFIRAEAYSPNQKGGMRKGIMGSMGVKSDFKISPKINVSLSTQIRKDSGCFGFDSGILGQGSIRVGFALSEKWSITPGIMGMIPLSHRRDGRVAATASEIALTHKF
jgi:hypothetical protein